MLQPGQQRKALPSDPWLSESAHHSVRTGSLGDWVPRLQDSWGPIWNTNLSLHFIFRHCPGTDIIPLVTHVLSFTHQTSSSKVSSASAIPPRIKFHFCLAKTVHRVGDVSRKQVLVFPHTRVCMAGVLGCSQTHKGFPAEPGHLCSPLLPAGYSCHGNRLWPLPCTPEDRPAVDSKINKIHWHGEGSESTWGTNVSFPPIE